MLPKQKAHKRKLIPKIDLYPYAEELYGELEKIGIIDRIKEIPQLGVIKVPGRLAKTRYDYMMLQQYLHQMIKKHLKGYLELAYNNYIDATEFREDYEYITGNNLLTGISKPSITDVLQLLTIIYNIGHFYNTFTASRAVTMLAAEDPKFADTVVSASASERYQAAARAILAEKNYHRMHLLNSILILEQCDQTKPSVSVALEILYAYINESMLPEDCKLKYAFWFFRNVRTVSYLAYDLQIADTPLTIDLCNEKAMVLLLRELLSAYNDNQYCINLVGSIEKLLDDTVYNENSNAICYYRISRKMVTLMKEIQGYPCMNYYEELFLNKKSVLNRIHTHKRDYIQKYILKLTFTAKERTESEALLTDLEKINNTRVGYYDRHSGKQTILVSIRKSCNAQAKRVAAFHSLKCAIKHLRRIEGIVSTDKRFILCVKFFLFYLFDEYPVMIKPTIDPETCVICTRGKKTRIAEVQSLLNKAGDSEKIKDVKHEVEFLLSQLSGDSVNDTSITVPASILVYQKDTIGITMSEFDGMILHPMRKANQIIFLEAKNRKEKPNFGKNCLKNKLKNFSLECNLDEIQTVNCDAYLKHTI